MSPTLLIDEVFAVGDTAFKHKCKGCSILLVSHVGSTVEDMCDDAIWLDAGRLMAQGSVGEVAEQYAARAKVHPSRLRAAPGGPVAP